MKRMIFITIYLLFCIIYGSAQYTVTTNVKTPKNSTVPDTRIFTGTDFSYTSPQLAALAADLQANYSAELISAPTKKYNCHAYAWHVSEGGNQVWIGYETSTAEDIYWTDGSYIEEPECIATKVSYHESGNHSAIRLNSTWYQSKWGDGPLVKHYLNNVPNGYNPSLQKKYYTLAPSISGPSTVCSSGATFTLNNLPDSASVSWDKSFNLAYVSGQGTISYKVKSSGGILPTVATASG
ncbi:MAG: hypothetical protein Q7W54_14520, partial [Bacteroidota bacterium]|nr:hypothetical protein [Bacteroidota bacterium]